MWKKASRINDFKKRNRAGFSLMEMIIVLALLSIGFLPLLLSFTSGITASADTGKTIIGIELTENKIEELKALPYASIVSSDEAKGTIYRFSDYSRRTTVDEIHVNLKNITVSTSWGDGNDVGAFELQTYVCNY